MQGILTRGLPGMVRSGGAASAQRRFDIYVNAYRTRLIDALRANYPVLHRALGMTLLSLWHRPISRHTLPAAPISAGSVISWTPLRVSTAIWFHTRHWWI